MNRIQASLRSVPAITAFFANRIYFDHAPDRTIFPYLVISREGADQNNTLKGRSGLEKGMYDFDFYAKSNKQRLEIFSALRDWCNANNKTPEISVVEARSHTGFDTLRKASHGLIEFHIWLHN